jgi:hypothetical protein
MSPILRKGLYCTQNGPIQKRAGGGDFISLAYETEIVTYRIFSLLAFQPKNKLPPDELSFPRLKSTSHPRVYPIAQR